MSSQTQGTDLCRNSQKLSFVTFQLLVRKAVFYHHHLRNQCPQLTTRSILIIGGTSGVGLEAARYLRRQGTHVHCISRRTGHDLNSAVHLSATFREAQGGAVAVSVGAGRRAMNLQQEVTLYENAAKSLALVPDVTLVAAVVRSIVVYDVREILDRHLSVPWVILRPGAMSDPPELEEDRGERGQHSSILVTSDYRCNGMASRRDVGTVLGDLLLGKIPEDQMAGQILGVYDESRMLRIPENAAFLGDNLWRKPIS